MQPWKLPRLSALAEAGTAAAAAAAGVLGMLGAVARPVAAPAWKYTTAAAEADKQQACVVAPWMVALRQRVPCVVA